jgi:hypothetical protein
VPPDSLTHVSSLVVTWSLMSEKSSMVTGRGRLPKSAAWGWRSWISLSSRVMTRERSGIR